MKNSVSPQISDAKPCLCHMEDVNENLWNLNTSYWVDFISYHFLFVLKCDSNKIQPPQNDLANCYTSFFSRNYFLKWNKKM